MNEDFTLDDDAAEDSGQENNQPSFKNEFKNERVSRFSLYKPKGNFEAGNPKTYGVAIQVDLVKRLESNGNVWPNVWITVAGQVAASPKEQEKKKGSKVFDWSKEKIIAFKCATTDLSQILSVLSYTEPSVGLFHKSEKGNTALDLICADVIAADPVQQAIKLWKEGDASKSIEPRTKGINPLAISFKIGRTKGEFRSCFFGVSEVIELRLYLEECLRRMYFS